MYFTCSFSVFFCHYYFLPWLFLINGKLVFVIKVHVIFNQYIFAVCWWICYRLFVVSHNNMRLSNTLYKWKEHNLIFIFVHIFLDVFLLRIIESLLFHISLNLNIITKGMNFTMHGSKILYPALTYRWYHGYCKYQSNATVKILRYTKLRQHGY